MIPFYIHYDISKVAYYKLRYAENCTDLTVEVRLKSNNELLIKGTDYEFRVTGDFRDYIGSSKRYDVSISGSGIYGGSIKESVYPLAEYVNNIQATQSDDSITVTWDPVEGASGYLVRRVVAGFVDIDFEVEGGNNTSIVDNKVQKEETYIYRVIALDQNGNIATQIIGKGLKFTGDGVRTFGPTLYQVKADTTNKVYFSETGNEVFTPSVTVYEYNGYYISPEYYTVSYENNDKPGWATIIVEGDGIHYRGTLTTSFVIYSYDIDISPGYEIGEIAEQAYTGTPVEPNCTLSFRGEQLERDKDYIITYENNNEPGIAAAVIKGIRKYKGVKNSEYSA